jgi:hypothetical protein
MSVKLRCKSEAVRTMRSKFKLSSECSDSGNKKCNPGYGGARV